MFCNVSRVLHHSCNPLLSGSTAKIWYLTFLLNSWLIDFFLLYAHQTLDQKIPNTQSTVVNMSHLNFRILINSQTFSGKTHTENTFYVCYKILQALEGFLSKVMSCGFTALRSHCLILSFKVRETICKSLQKTGIFNV